MSGSLDRPIAAYSSPGPDQNGASLQELAEQFLAALGAEAQSNPQEEAQVVQFLLAGIHQIGTQRVGPPGAPPSPVSNESAPVGQNSPGTQDAIQPPPGQQFTTLT